MAKVSSTQSVSKIGKVAGVVWNVLAKHGPLSITKLVKTTGEPRDAVMQAIGWLAREKKISIEEEGRSRTISLL